MIKLFDLCKRAIPNLCVGLGSFFLSSALLANPVLNNVEHGNVSIQQTPTTTTINQSSQQAILNWQSFNIQQGEYTHFEQPTNGVALNRISGSQGASEIYGHLSATGQIILINPAGVFFSPSAFVNVGGLIASTANITNADFLSGNFKFNQVSPDAGMIINKGTIIAAQNGLVMLLGNGVQNDGTIQANLGKVVLASGSAFSMSFAGNDLVSFAVDAGSVKGITNTGTISANGGQVIVSAKAASNVLDQVINMDGIVEAKAVELKQGQIILSSDLERGLTKVSGKLDASSETNQGGVITVLGNNIVLSNSANLNVSGYLGGGNVFIGGNYLGQGPLPNAANVSFASQAVIQANATQMGDGGKVIIWSNNHTAAHGNIDVSGGAQGGNGGFIETSGKHSLDVSGISVNLSSINGDPGTWLLDPANLTITSSNNLVTGSSPFEPTAENGATGSYLSVTTLVNALNSGNVTVQTNDDGFTGDGDIIVASAISWSGATTLLLNAFNNIQINAAITATQGTLSLQAGSATNTILTSDAGNINVNNFNLLLGQWKQVVGQDGLTALPEFNVANDFQLNSGILPDSDQVMFLRMAGGDGTSGNPYQVTDIYGLQGLGSNTDLFGDYYNVPELNKYIIFVSDIDASGTINWNNGEGFVPIASTGGNFFTDIDGQGHVIRDLYINRPGDDYQGLIAQSPYVAYALWGVRNLGLINPRVTGRNYVGTLAGQTGGIDSNVFAENVTVVGQNYVGGLIGYKTNDLIHYAYTSGSVTGNYYVGGLIGDVSFAGGAANTYSTATVSGNQYIGGLIGRFTYNNTVLRKSYASGLVSGNNYVGGLIGYGSVSSASQIENNNFFDYESAGVASNAACGYSGTGCENIIPMAFGTGIGDASNITTFTNAGWDVGTDPTANDWIMMAGQTRPILSMEIYNSSTSSYYTDISTAHQLQFIGWDATSLAESYTIKNNINLSGTSGGDIWGSQGFIPLGDATTAFTGNFDGNKHLISGLYINNTDTSKIHTGLFGYADLSLNSITQVNLANVNISGGDYTGSIVGTLNSGTVSESQATGDIYRSFNTGGGEGSGGLIGQLVSGTLDQSYSAVNLNYPGSLAYTSYGGLVGAQRAGTISNSYSTGSVTGAVSGGPGSGGLVGYFGGGTIENSYATGAISGSNTGGLIGWSNASTTNITNNFWDTATTGKGNAVGWGNALPASNLGNVFGSGTDELANSGTYSAAGWDIGNSLSNTWVILDGKTRPMLAMEYQTEINTPHALQLVELNGTTSAADYLLLSTIDLEPGMSNKAEVWGTNKNAGTTTAETGEGWIPIGDTSDYFDGSIDGRLHKVENLFINRPDDGFQGLFGYAENASLNNIGVTGDMTVLNFSGGLVGLAINTSINNAYSKVKITADDGAYAIGGLAGYVIGAVSNVFSSSKINITGNATGTGGLIGRLDGYTLDNAYFDGSLELTGSGYQVGGLLGESWGSQISNVYFNGSLSMTDASYEEVGLIAGMIRDGADITNAYATGYVSGYGIRGIVGATCCGSPTEVLNAYWDMATTGVTTTYNFGDGISGTGISSASSMKQSSTYGGFDFSNTWGIQNGTSLPYLKAFYPGTPRIIKGTQSDAANGMQINLVSDGQLIGSAPVTSAKTFYFLTGYNRLTGSGAITDNTPIMLYYDDAASKANFITIAPTNNSSLTLTNHFTTNTTKVTPTTGNFTILSSDFYNLKGNLTDDDILFSFDTENTNDILFDEGSFQIDGGVAMRAFGDLQVNNGNITINDILEINDDNFNIAANEINISTYLINTNSTHSFVNAGSSSINILSNGSAAFTKDGEGSLTVNNQNNFNGTLTGLSGELTIDGFSAYGTGSVILNGSNLNVSGTSTLSDELSVLSATTITSTGGTLTIDQAINSANALSILAVGGSLQLNADITSTGGPLVIGGGSISNSQDIAFTSSTHNVTIDGDLSWTGSNSLTLDAATSVGIGGTISGPNGSLIISAANSPNSVYTYGTSGVGVNTFNLAQGHWEEVGSLSSFNANNFQINSGGLPSATASFFRAAGGDGSSGDPYQIVDIYGLQGIASNDTTLGYHYILNNDISAATTSTWNSGAGFVPIGTAINPFTGSFAGNKKVISNLTIDRDTTDNVGLFGYVSGNSITELGLTGTITGQDNVGSIAGYMNGTIENSYADVDVTGNDKVGGLVGELGSSGSISKSYAAGTVSGTTNSGGLAGNNAGAISASFWDTAATGQANASGSGAGSETNVVGGCLGATSCANSDPSTLDLSLRTTYESAPYSWDFDNVWGFADGVTYPTFRFAGRYISGILPSAQSLNLKLVVDGVLIDTLTLTSDTFEFAVPTASLADGQAYLIYTSGGTYKANVISLASTGNSDISGITLEANTLLLGQDTITQTISSSTLANAKGALSDADILYTMSGNDITVSSGNKLRSADATTFNVEGNITTSGSNATFDGPTLVTAASTISTGSGKITFNGNLDSANGNQDLILNSSGETRFYGVTGAITPLQSITTDSAGSTIIRNDITTTGNQTYYDGVQVAGDIHLRASTFNFYNSLKQLIPIVGYELDVCLSGCDGFDINPITGGTTISANLDDNLSSSITLPFEFNFYGINYDSLQISTNGNLSFGGLGSSTASAGTLPNSGTPNALVAPLWSDLWPRSDGIRYITTGTEGSRIFSIEYPSSTGYYAPGEPTGNANFKVSLYEGSNQIKFFYGDIDIGAQTSEYTTIGIENQTGDQALVYLNRQLINNTDIASLIPNGTILTFTPDGLSNEVIPDANVILTGDVNFNSVSYSAITPNSLTINGDTTFRGATTIGEQTYNGNVTINSTSYFRTTNSDVTINGNYNATSNYQSYFYPGSGTVTINGDVGNVYRPYSVYIYDTGNFVMNGNFGSASNRPYYLAVNGDATIGGDVYTYYRQDFQGDLTLSANTLLDTVYNGTTDYGILINTVYGNGYDLILNPANEMIIDHNITNVGSLTTGSQGSTSINGATISTNGSQTYNNSVSLSGNNAALTTLDNLIFNNTVTLGGNNPILTASNDIIFNDNVLLSAPAATFNAGGTAYFNGSLTGAISYSLDTCLVDCANSDITSLTTFNQVHTNAGDAVTGGLDIGFTFNFFGSDFTQFMISTNGNIQLGSSGGSSAYNPLPLPSSGTPNNMIAALWTDLRAGADGIRYNTEGDVGSRVLTVEYPTTSAPWSGGGSINVFIKLYEGSNLIEMHYGPIAGAGIDVNRDYTVGVENGSGTLGTAYLSDTYLTGAQRDALLPVGSVLTFTQNTGGASITVNGDAVFSQPLNQTDITVSGNATLASATTSGRQSYGSLTISGSSNATLTSTAADISIGAVTGNNHNLTISAADDSVITGNITNVVNLSKTGSGNFELSGNNSLTGVVSANGDIILNHDNALGAGSLALNTGANLRLNDVNISNSISFVDNGPTSASITGSGDSSLSNSLSLVSDLSINTLALSDSLSVGSINGAHALTINGPGTVTLAGNIGNSSALSSLTADSPITINANINTLGDQIYNGRVDNTGNHTLSLSGNADAMVHFDDVITGTGTLNINGAGSGRYELSANTGLDQNWRFTGLDSGTLSGDNINQVINFSNMRDITGGTADDTYLFIGNARSTGFISAGPQTAMNTIDLTQYNQLANLTLSDLVTFNGSLNNASDGAQVASFININSITNNPAHSNAKIKFPAGKFLDLRITSAFNGEIADPLYFTSFGSFAAGSGGSARIIIDGDAMFNPNNMTVTIGGVTMSFDGFLESQFSGANLTNFNNLSTATQQPTNFETAPVDTGTNEPVVAGGSGNLSGDGEGGAFMEYADGTTNAISDEPTTDVTKKSENANNTNEPTTTDDEAADDETEPTTPAATPATDQPAGEPSSGTDASDFFGDSEQSASYCSS